MVESLPIHVNREQLHDLEVPRSFEASGSFDVRLVNHGPSSHVHLHLDDALSSMATIDANNHFVDGNSERFVGVTVREGATGRGKLKVVSGYGAQTRYIDVDLTEPENGSHSVQVDESLAKPQPSDTGGEDALVFERPVIPVLGLAGVALLVAVGAALLLRQFVVAIGAFAVLTGVVVALYLLVSE
ncbi:MAG: DUF7524 family protein [Halorhabdus sp.]